MTLVPFDSMAAAIARWVILLEAGAFINPFTGDGYTITRITINFKIQK
jgi:hypothetical protein